MIDKDRIDDRRKYTCDGIKDDDTPCGAIAYFRNYDEARKPGGWSVSYWRDKCYCPECAPKYKSVGCAGIKKGNGEQLRFDEYKQI